MNLCDGLCLIDYPKRHSLHEIRSNKKHLAKFFFTPILCTYTSSPLGGMAKNIFFST